jgi:bifunctional DNA-binding transcriptional regulator/antitoxin component of YhaV-PrlF toxin-antitoxin module
MPKRRFIRKLTKKGKYSYLLIVPKTIITALGWRERQKVVLRIFGKNKILISDWKKAKRK